MLDSRTIINVVRKYISYICIYVYIINWMTYWKMSTEFFIQIIFLYKTYYVYTKKRIYFLYVNIKNMFIQNVK